MIAVACVKLSHVSSCKLFLPLSKMISLVALQGTRVLCVKNTVMYNWSGMFLHFWSQWFLKINMAVNMLMFDMEGYFFI